MAMSLICGGTFALLAFAAYERFQKAKANDKKAQSIVFFVVSVLSAVMTVIYILGMIFSAV